MQGTEVTTSSLDLTVSTNPERHDKIRRREEGASDICYTARWIQSSLNQGSSHDFDAVRV